MGTQFQVGTQVFWHIPYCKVQKSNFITKCVRYYKVWQISLLQSAPGITKFDRLYYKVRQVLQSAIVTTKCVRYYKVLYSSGFVSVVKKEIQLLGVVTCRGDEIQLGSKYFNKKEEYINLSWNQKKSYAVYLDVIIF